MSQIVTGPITGGTHGWPFGSPSDDPAAAGYVEEEFVLSGEAERYGPRPGTELSTDGRWDVEPVARSPFATRIVVYRPADPSAFNGTVLVSWNNVSMGHDLFVPLQASFSPRPILLSTLARRIPSLFLVRVRASSLFQKRCLIPCAGPINGEPAS